MQEFQINKTNYHQHRTVDVEPKILQQGEVRASIDRFAFTANNITLTPLLASKSAIGNFSLLMVKTPNNGALFRSGVLLILPNQNAMSCHWVSDCLAIFYHRKS